jgi:CDP-diacylglycerol---serine O-phosphatidyltransferase
MIGNQRIDPELTEDIEVLIEPRRRRVRLIPMLPSLVTLGNLFCGFLAISYTADAVVLALTDRTAAVDRIALAGFVVMLAMVFDALDGRVARITGQVTDFGGHLDSLADMVTFGVAPAFMTKALAEQILHLSNHRVTLGFCVFFVLCAALRLARYGAEEDPEESGHQTFLGLPSPGAAGVVAAVAVFYARFADWAPSHYAIAALPYLVPLLGILMISRIPYPHVMNRYFRGSKPMKYLVLLAGIVVVAMVLHSIEVVLVGLTLFFAFSGPVSFFVRLVTGRAKSADLEIFD